MTKRLVVQFRPTSTLYYEEGQKKLAHLVGPRSALLPLHTLLRFTHKPCGCDLHEKLGWLDVNWLGLWNGPDGQRAFMARRPHVSMAPWQLHTTLAAATTSARHVSPMMG